MVSLILLQYLPYDLFTLCHEYMQEFVGHLHGSFERVQFEHVFLLQSPLRTLHVKNVGLNARVELFKPTSTGQRTRIWSLPGSYDIDKVVQMKTNLVAFSTLRGDIHTMDITNPSSIQFHLVIPRPDEHIQVKVLRATRNSSSGHVGLLVGYCHEKVVVYDQTTAMTLWFNDPDSKRPCAKFLTPRDDNVFLNETCFPTCILRGMISGIQTWTLGHDHCYRHTMTTRVQERMGYLIDMKTHCAYNLITGTSSTRWTRSQQEKFWPMIYDPRWQRYNIEAVEFLGGQILFFHRGSIPNLFLFSLITGNTRALGYDALVMRGYSNDKESKALLQTRTSTIILD